MALPVFVSGGTGFLGTLIVEAIKKKYPDWTITVFDLQPPKESSPDVIYLQGDVTNAVDVSNAISQTKPRVIIHSAGIVPPLEHRFSRQLEARVIDVNVNGTRNMLTAAKTNNVEAFVWTGSCTAITDDTRYQYRDINETHPTPSQSLIYGESKALAEKHVLSANDDSPTLSTCALRPSVLFGPGDSQLIPSIHACIAKGETPFILGSGLNLWDVGYAPNIADAHVLAVENLLTSKTAAGEAFFIQNNEPVTFRDFCLEVWKNFGHYPPFEVRVPMRVAWVCGWVAEWFTWVTGMAVTLSRGSILDACAIRYASGEKARRILGYEASVGIEQGIRISCQEYSKRLKAQEAGKSEVVKARSVRNSLAKRFVEFGLLDVK